MLYIKVVSSIYSHSAVTLHYTYKDTFHLCMRKQQGIHIQVIKNSYFKFLLYEAPSEHRLHNSKNTREALVTCERINKRNSIWTEPALRHSIKRKFAYWEKFPRVGTASAFCVVRGTGFCVLELLETGVSGTLRYISSAAFLLGLTSPPHLY